jgi:molybdopterin-guanine dinucleotide biosynthesis protein A
MGGQDKGLLVLNGRPMIDYVIRALRPQVSSILINANRNREDYRTFGFPVIEDAEGGYLGPLAGMVSALRATSDAFVLTVPCDSPFLPQRLGQRMRLALLEAEAELAVASDGRRQQPVFLLLRSSLETSMFEFLRSGERKIDLWFQRHKAVEVDFSDSPEAFANVNTPEELLAAETKLTGATMPSQER